MLHSWNYANTLALYQIYVCYFCEDDSKKVNFDYIVVPECENHSKCFMSKCINWWLAQIKVKIVTPKFVNYSMLDKLIECGEVNGNSNLLFYEPFLTKHKLNIRNQRDYNKKKRWSNFRSVVKPIYKL